MVSLLSGEALVTVSCMSNHLSCTPLQSYQRFLSLLDGGQVCVWDEECPAVVRSLQMPSPWRFKELHYDVCVYTHDTDTSRRCFLDWTSGLYGEWTAPTTATQVECVRGYYHTVLLKVTHAPQGDKHRTQLILLPLLHASTIVGRDAECTVLPLAPRVVWALDTKTEVKVSAATSIGNVEPVVLIGRTPWILRGSLAAVE